MLFPLSSSSRTKTMELLTQLMLLVSVISNFHLSNCNTVVVKEANYDVLPMSGAYLEEQDVSVYDTIAPLIFKLDRPNWIGQMPLFLGYPCNTDKYTEATLCPVFYYLHKHLSTGLKNILNLPSTNLPATDIEIKFDCDQVSKHFTSFRVTDSRLEEYIQKLQKCSDSKIYISDLSSLNSSTITDKFRSTYDKMMSRFMEEYHNHLPTTSRENKAAELNNRLALTSLIITHLSALGDQWENALSECTNGFIPISLISPTTLQEGLESLEKIITDEVFNFKFSIEYSGSQVSQYYKSPLADCVLTGNKLYIRVLVPVLKKRKTPAGLVKIKSVPFHTQNDIHELCMIVGFEHGRYFNVGLQQGTGSIVLSQAMEVNCDVNNFHLCKIPPALDSVVDTATDCARAIITNDNERSDESGTNVKHACPLKCSPLDVDKLPLVVKSKDSEHTVFVIMNPDTSDNLLLECEKKDDTQIITAPRIGVLGIRIPCKCKLILKTGLTIYPVLTTCTNDLTVVNAIPFDWIGKNLV